MIILDYFKAKDVYVKQFHRGRNIGKPLKAKELPYSNCNNDTFILVDVLLVLIDNYPLYAGLVEQYSKETIDEPVWLSFGRKHRDGKFRSFWNRRFQVRDGNHRVEAEKVKKSKTIKAYMPLSHWEEYNEQNNNNKK